MKDLRKVKGDERSLEEVDTDKYFTGTMIFPEGFAYSHSRSGLWIWFADHGGHDALLLRVQEYSAVPFYFKETEDWPTVSNVAYVHRIEVELHDKGAL